MKQRSTTGAGPCLVNRNGKPHVKQENRRARRQRKAKELEEQRNIGACACGLQHKTLSHLHVHCSECGGRWSR